MEPRTLWVVRHAPVAVRGMCYGQSDVPVTIEAEHAARRVAVALGLATGPGQRGDRLPRRSTGSNRLAPVDEIAASPWARARAPAERLAAWLGVPLRIDDRLAELSFGEWEGRSYADIEREDGARLAAWMSDYMSTAPPGGETAQMLVDRVESWLRAQLGSGGSCLVFTHAGVIRSLRALARHARYRDTALEPVEHLVPEPIDFE